MPRPRFERLAAEKRTAILREAAEEFAVNGFESASYNRIIERTGLSKGAMYYYFDDKEDLYHTVLRQAFAPLVELMTAVPEVDTAEEFWRELYGMYERVRQAFQDDPALAGLARNAVKQMVRETSNQAHAELLEQALEWTKKFVRRGQEVGAVRTDLPFELLVNVLLAMGEAMDLWLLEQWGQLPPQELERISVTMMDMFRQTAMPQEEQKR